MLTSLFAPVVAAAVLAAAVTALHRQLPPAFAARVVTAVLLVVCTAALPSLWIISLGFLAHAPIIGGGFRWCSMAFGLHHHLPVVVALPALLCATVGTTRAFKAWRVHRKLLMHDPGPIEHADDPNPYAVAMPGRGGRIVMSRGLVNLLTDDEINIVLAHERTHAHFRHDRMLLVARMADACCPVLRPLTQRLRFSLERWADEAAARRCGDRRLVARTLAKVALATNPTPVLLGFAGLGVSARAEAMLAPAPKAPGISTLIGILGGIAMTAALSILQLHHLGALITALCHS
jgi:Peptidase family M48